MLVLHAGLLDSQFLLWGEVPHDPNLPLVKPRKRATRESMLSKCPYDAGPERLASALPEAVPELSGGLGDPRTCVAWLPTAAGKPVPSSPLIAEPSANGDETSLAPWTVSVLPLTAQQAVDLLSACLDHQTVAPGVVVGTSLAYWATALRFAASLVARQQFLPGFISGEDGFRARWEPVIAGADGQRLAQLAAAMPGACRGLSSPADTAPVRPAAALLSAFLDETVDQLVRSTIAPPAAITPVQRRRKLQPAFDSTHAHWLHALRTPDGAMTGDAAELKRLTEQVRDWRRPLASTAASAFRLCFRLEEPANGEKESELVHAPATPWQVRYLLQAADDPSLLVPVADAWSARGRQAGLLQRSGFHPREYLLGALGEAARVSPGIDASLKAAAPGGYELDAGAALQFLLEQSWQLEQMGFGVFLPAWWSRKGGKLRLAARAHVRSPSMTGQSGLSLDDLVHVDWQVVLGDDPLSLRELETLARLKAPLVQVRGRWVQLSAEEIQAAIDFWKKKELATVTARDALNLALGAEHAPAGLELESVFAEGWVSDLLGQMEGRVAFEELAAPAGFHGMLRPYQVRGYSWLAFLRRWGLGACLADDMGLGKTIQTLALVLTNWESNGQRRPVLLVSPMSVMGNWQKEAERFTPDLPVLVHHGLGRRKGAAFKKEVEKQALVVTSYALLHRDLEALKNIDWEGVVLDEGQNIKNPQTKQAQAARALKAGYRAALTGTPVENHVGDLWSIMEFLNPGLLGTQAEFKRTFFYPIQANRDPDAARQLKRRTGPFLLRRLKTDKTIIADLPDKLEMKVFCNLTKEQASLYAAVVEESLKGIQGAEGIQRKGLVLATLSKLKQVCNHPAQFLGDNSPLPGRSGKVARLTEMLEEILEVGDRALVFTQFAEMGEIVRRHLQDTFGREVLFLHGGVPKKQRDHLVEHFQSEEGPPIFLLSLKAGGTGLNLTRANHVFHFDRWWNPAVENQATDRAFRIGQTRNVQVHKYLCVGTLEEKIDAMIEGKQEIAARVVGTGEGWLTELSTNELKELFALREEALGE